MKEKNSWIIILAIIAIILSIIAIYISLNKDNNSNNYVTREELYKEHALISTALQNSDFSTFRGILDAYNLCIRRAILAYAGCSQTTNVQCYNNLNLEMADCIKS